MVERARQPIGRPRDSRVDEAITRAVRELLAEVGYTGLTMDAVAARAGVGKAAIYRRYATKQEMVFAAAIHGETLEVPPDSGSLLGDLTALARVIVGHLSNPAASGTLLSLLGEITTDPALAERFTRTFVEPERAGNAELLERAVRRGELERMPDVDLFHAVFGGAVLSWLFISRHDPHDLPERLARFACAALRSAEPHPPTAERRT
ncbi:TetR/AcrR family transcriptional regulator [Nonomuraea sp. SYSU D8015]|uniref:TetR/AcrR family transcriptional regulator n=1 Tax=Nonomuraea sp. SYSU D8015 TaxID=2593644 RepID=UPI0016601203|nr:TetR/AcrR family transcriptional regulator [Nonomuraea sp. SYSU D8015]